MRAPATPAASRAIELFDTAPRADRFHVRARWWSCPFPAIERHVPVAGRVLEVGSGHGLLSLYLALSCPTRSVVGVDIDLHKVILADGARARLEPGEAEVEFHAVEPGVLPAGPFDAIVINDVLYLMPEAMRRAVLDGCIERLAPDGVLLVKELDVAPRWKYEVGRVQEIVATRLLEFTQGEEMEIAPMADFAAQLRDAGLDVTTHRIDRGYPHPHQLVIGRHRSLPAS
jgi:2-polyprenyl-3-methyl-5-hydroxy-6-metoxy-1,4-benzoquinol methylase